MYIVTGASGNIGGRLAEILLENGKDVAVVGRTPERLAPLVEKGAQARIGSLEDGAFLARAFAGAEAAFLMIPPNPAADDFRAFQDRVGAALTEAVGAAKVRHVVNLSSLGGHLAAGNGPIAGLHAQEERLNRLKGVNVVHLRPAFFMENHLTMMDLVRGQGINGSPLKPDLAFPVIATRDIARVAGDLLLGRTFRGHTVRELLGPGEMTMREMTRLLGVAIGRPALPYVQFPYEDARKAMTGMGVSADAARLFLEMYQAFNEGRLGRGPARTEENTTETSFEEFARTSYAALYAKGSKP